MIDRLLPTCFLVAYESLFPGNDLTTSAVPGELLAVPWVRRQLVDMSSRLLRMDWSSPHTLDNVEDLIERFRITESVVSCAVSLTSKFPDQKELWNSFLRNVFEPPMAVDDLTTTPPLSPMRSIQVPVGSELRPMVETLFSRTTTAGHHPHHGTSSYPAASSREFIMEYRQPSQYQHRGSDFRLVQRMHATLRDGEFRLLETRSKETFCVGDSR